jgi:hypothetical protein
MQNALQRETTPVKARLPLYLQGTKTMVGDERIPPMVPRLLRGPWPYRWLFAVALLLIVIRSLTVYSRSPDDFNFGGEFDALITAREYATKPLAETHLLSYIASYDAAKQRVDVWHYTHYPATQYLPTVILSRYFGARYSAQFELGNLAYLVFFCVMLFTIFRRHLTERGAALFALLALLLFYKGYWQAILGSLGTPYTLEIVVAPLLVYAVARERYALLAAGLGLLCLDTYDAYLPCLLCLLALGFLVKRRRYVLAAFALPAFAFALRLAINLAYYHSPQLVAGDLLNAAGQRSGGCVLSSIQTAENVKNYGGTPECSLGARLAKQVERIGTGFGKLPSDALTSYRWGIVLFFYGLLRALYALVLARRRRTAPEYGPVFIVAYCAGTALFGILLPEAMLLGGWTFFDLMPVPIWGMAMLYRDARPWWDRLPAGPWIPRFVTLAALFVLCRHAGVPAAISDREVNRFAAAHLACGSGALVTTNLDFHYFAYLCGTEGYRLAYSEKKPGEPSFVTMPGLPSFMLGDVEIRGR